MTRRKSRPDEPPLLPVKLDPVSNGEFVPPPLDPRVRAAQRRAHARAEVAARRLGVSRRDFLATSAGAATVFLALNEIGCSGGRYDVPPEAGQDPTVARPRRRRARPPGRIASRATSSSRTCFSTATPTWGC
jgi:hypothetical protein